MIASITAGSFGFSPFQSHSWTPPPSRIAAANAVGAACSSSIASIRFDFPEPFGPITTFNGARSIRSDPGANERNPSRRIDLMNLVSDIVPDPPGRGLLSELSSNCRGPRAVSPLDDFRETAPAEKKAGNSLPACIDREGVSREYWPRSAIQHKRGVQPFACLAKHILDLGKFPLAHHPEEQPVEIGLELDQAVIALARSRARWCGFTVGDRDGLLFRFPSPFLAVIGSFRAGRRLGLGATLAAQIAGQPHVRPRLVDQGLADRPLHPRCRPGLVDCFRIGKRVIDQQLLDKGCLALISCLCWHDCISRRVVPAHFFHRSSINNQCKLQNQEVDPGSHKKEYSPGAVIAPSCNCTGKVVTQQYGELATQSRGGKAEVRIRKPGTHGGKTCHSKMTVFRLPLTSTRFPFPRPAVVCHLPFVICHLSSAMLLSAPLRGAASSFSRRLR